MEIPKQPVIEFKDVSISFNDHKVLDNLNFEVKKGEVYVIIGYSGTGKSVTLRTLVGLLTPDMGSIKVAGDQIVGMDEGELQIMRRRFGYLFQSGALINWLTVAENVELPLREHTTLRPARRKEIVMEKLKHVAMVDAADKYPSEISGGMKKRVGLARAIALDPEIVLFDEPSSGLDPVMAREIDELILAINKDLGITCLVVTHDMDSVFALADRVGFFFKGNMRFVGTAEELRNVQDAETQKFISGGASVMITAASIRATRALGNLNQSMNKDVATGHFDDVER